MDVEAPPAAPEEAAPPVNHGDDQRWESQCWGCSSFLALPYFSEAFKCGWCGAVTLSKTRERPGRRCRRLAAVRDGVLVTLVLAIVALLTVGGIWTVYPILYPQPRWSGYLLVSIAILLAAGTIVSYSLAAFVPAGGVIPVPWGSIYLVGKSALDGYTYCVHCARPKPPQAHHCRTCGTCVLDMDHHCPFIGNCVGAHNHGHFILFLVHATISSMYILIMGTLAGVELWPPLMERYQGSGKSGWISSVGTVLAASFLDAIEGFEEQQQDAAVSRVPVRSLALLYLVATALAIMIGLALLLWQQLLLLYQGQTYLDSIQAGRDDDQRELLRPGWHNLRRLFGKNWWRYKKTL